VFEAWTKPELLMRWWAPKSFGVSFLSCEADVRVGGRYRFVFAHPASKQPMKFFGRYIEVSPHSRLVWTNDEGGAGGAVTTVTFDEKGGKTLLVMHDLYPSKEALDGAIASGSTSGMGETFEQLDELLVALGASLGRSLVSRSSSSPSRTPSGPPWTSTGRSLSALFARNGRRRRPASHPLHRVPSWTRRSVDLPRESIV
jgi:uncharacterized protein YndB with AHSA1/START domain